MWLPACPPACLPACLCIRTLPARVPQASFVGRRLLQDEDDTPTVTFPDDYPNSVRHFLLIGFLGMFIGAIVFFYMGISRKVNTVMHVLTFFVAAVSACAYYAEWAGLGVEYKTTDTTPRVIFWAHYLDWVVTGPVSPACFVLYNASQEATAPAATRWWTLLAGRTASLLCCLAAEKKDLETRPAELGCVILLCFCPANTQHESKEELQCALPALRCLEHVRGSCLVTACTFLSEGESARIPCACVACGGFCVE